MKTLYIGGLVFDGIGNLLEDHGVLVDGERISKIAPSSEFEGYSGEKTDTSGGTLLPGLIDCHVHLVYCGEADPKSSLLKLGPGQIVMNAFENAQKTLSSGVTSIRDLGGRDYLEFSVRDACNPEVPELTTTQYFTPKNSDNFFSNFSISSPIAQVFPRLIILFTIFSSSSSV